MLTGKLPDIRYDHRNGEMPQQIGNPQLPLGATILETYVQSKTGNEADCEDVILYQNVLHEIRTGDCHAGTPR